MNDDGTIVQSIESPGAFDTSSTDRRPQEARPHLIDLTSSAEEASQQRRPSPSPPRALYMDQPTNDAQRLHDGRPQHRQLIELDHNVPSPRVFQHDGLGRGQIALTNDRYVTRAPNDRHAQDIRYDSDVARDQALYNYPNARRVVYEPVMEQRLLHQPVRYVADEPFLARHVDRNGQVYRLNDHETIQRPSLQSNMLYEEKPRRIIVLDTPDPMEGVQRTGPGR